MSIHLRYTEVAAEPFSGPHILLPTLVVSWGLVCTFQGFVHNYSGLLAARFFLGLTEGAILPVSLTHICIDAAILTL